jgi:hypothetical protein
MRRAVLIVVAALLGATLGAGVAVALWSKTITVPTAAVTTSPVVIGSHGLGADDDVVTAQDGVISVPFTQQDAQAVRAASANVIGGQVDWVKPFTIYGETTGTLGFAYTVDLPDLSNSYYAADVFIFPVQDPAAECDPANPPDVASMAHPDAASLAVEPALDVDYTASKSYEQAYCMAAHFVPRRYTNTAEATLQVFDGMTNTPAVPSCTIEALCDGAPEPQVIDESTNDVVEQSTWWAGILADTVAEPVVTFDFNVTVLQYGP